jgi:hypothetical protein
MPGYYKPRRRRHTAALNKNEQKVRRGQEDERMAQMVGVMKDRFPHVVGMNVQLQFVTPQNETYESEVREFGPEAVCDFSVQCPGRCGGTGSFDLAGKIRSVLEARQERADAQGICRQILAAGTSDECGFRLRCKIEADYID